MVFCSLAFNMQSSAQGRGGGGDDRPDREQLEAMKIAYITKELDLSPEEAKMFWPVYEQRDEALHALRKERRNHLRDAKKNRDSWNDEQILTFLDREMQFKEQEVAIISNYHEQLKTVLPPKKLAKLYFAEEGFKRKLLKSMREGNMPDRRREGGN